MPKSEAAARDVEQDTSWNDLRERAQRADR
jgi:hypothetical protein